MQQNKTVVFLVLFFILMGKAVSQDYKHSVSGQTGAYWGICYKRVLENESAYRGSLLFKHGGLLLSGVRMFHKPLVPQKNSQLFYYYGYGAHMAYASSYYSYNVFKPFRPASQYRGSFFTAGMDGLVGVEYRFLKHPFVVAVDFQPNFEFFGPTYFKLNIDQVEASVAFTF